MADRATIVTILRVYLGTSSDDPAYTDTILNPIVQQAVDSLLTDINEANPDYNTKTVTLAADSTSSRIYTFATQSSAITDFSAWREIKALDSSGFPQIEVRFDELRASGSDHFTISGIDQAAVLERSFGSPAGQNLFMRYTTWPALLVLDTDVPGGIPLRFHDVISLEMLFAFALGGEQRIPPNLEKRWFDRRQQLMRHVGQRGAQPSRTRLYGDMS